jgi:hypothetical protein
VSGDDERRRSTSKSDFLNFFLGVNVILSWVRRREFRVRRSLTTKKRSPSEKLFGIQKNNAAGENFLINARF